MKAALRPVTRFLVLVCFEGDRDLRLHLDGLTVEVVGLISPLAYSVQRGTGKNGVSLKYMQVGDVSLFADGRLDLYGALRVDRKRGRRIFWLHPLD
jgi:hypothetical protein